jgi:hypothetical protein
VFRFCAPWFQGAHLFFFNFHSVHTTIYKINSCNNHNKNLIQLPLFYI